MSFSHVPGRLGGRRLRGALVALLAIAAGSLLLAAPPAPAKTKLVTLDGFNERSTPDEYDKVGVLKMGRKRARNVLILNAGTSGSSAYLKPVARQILARKRNWQVWAIERRENLLEDHSMIDAAKRDKAGPQELFDYYLGWLGNPDPPARHFQPVADADVPFARNWGMKVAVRDIHKVVRRADRRFRRVVMGGHSLGASITTAYATWDFNGRPGGRHLSGLVLIDGGTGGESSAAEAEQELDDLEASSPFIDLVGLGLPWAAGVFNAMGSMLALEAPNAPSILHDWPLLPGDLKPPVRPTSEAGYGYALDTETGPPDLALVQMHLGHLAKSGDPRAWVDGELVPVRRAARLFAGKGLLGLDGTAWYHPRRLSIDGGAVNAGIANPAQRILDVDATHGRDLKLPIYSFGALGGDRVLDAARELAEQSGIPKRKLTLIDRGATYAHIDPLAAFPRNAFVNTVGPFLRTAR